jgi:hypothetical protein
MGYKRRKSAESIGRIKMRYIDDCNQRKRRMKRLMGKSELREKLMKDIGEKQGEKDG